MERVKGQSTNIQSTSFPQKLRNFKLKSLVSYKALKELRTTTCMHVFVHAKQLQKAVSLQTKVKSYSLKFCLPNKLRKQFSPTETLTNVNSSSINV